MDYIHYNPVKHGYVTRPTDWQYSTFHRFVEDGVLRNNWGVSVDDNGEFGELVL